MYIDPKLEQQSQRDADKITDVIIGCSGYSDAFETQLEQAGLDITNREHAAHGMVYGRLRLGDLPNLRKVEGIESIEPDSTQYAL